MSEISASQPPVELASAVAQAFQPPVTCARMIWCKSAALMNVYICAQQQLSASYQEPTWKIAMLRVDQYDTEGRPINVRQIGYLSTRVELKGSVSKMTKLTNEFTYEQMMRLMEQYYSPSNPDPMTKFPDHITDELRRWNRAKEEALQAEKRRIFEQDMDLAATAGGTGNPHPQSFPG